MARNPTKSELLQGTLEMLILRTLEHASAHGHDISRHIRRTSRDVFQVEHGSLYPALHRLERRGLIAARWKRHPERNRDFRYYHLTAAGRRQLVAERSRWEVLVAAIANVMHPVEEP